MVAWRGAVRCAGRVLASCFQVGEVIAKSDYILVAAALTPETKGMVGAAELARVRFLKRADRISPRGFTFRQPLGFCGG